MCAAGAARAARTHLQDRFLDAVAPIYPDLFDGPDGELKVHDGSLRVKLRLERRERYPGALAENIGLD